MTAWLAWAGDDLAGPAGWLDKYLKISKFNVSKASKTARRKPIQVIFYIYNSLDYATYKKIHNIL